MLEIVHNTNRLQCRRGYKVYNARGLERLIQRFTDTRRDRGLRIRYAVDLPTNYLHLETRSAMAMDTIVTYLRSIHALRERVTPKDL